MNPRRPLHGFYMMAREVKRSLKACPDRCVFGELIDWCDPKSRQLKTSLREIAESVNVSHMTVSRALERIAKLGYITLEKIPRSKGGMTITLSDACFPGKSHKRKGCYTSVTESVTEKAAPAKDNYAVLKDACYTSVTETPKSQYLILNTKEEKNIIQRSLSLEPSQEGKSAILAEAWFAYKESKRRRMKGTLNSFAKAIFEACREVGCSVDTLAFAFYLKREEPPFWHDKLFTPHTLLEKWKNGYKLETLLDQCKGDKSMLKMKEEMDMRQAMQEWVEEEEAC